MADDETAMAPKGMDCDSGVRCKTVPKAPDTVFQTAPMTISVAAHLKLVGLPDETHYVREVTILV